MKSKLKSKNTSNKINLIENIITINAELPIPLGELAVYILSPGEDESCLLEILYNNTEVINKEIRKILREILNKRKSEIKMKELVFEYNDSDKFNHGVAHFKARLRGTKKELRKVAGVNKLFFFDWKEYNQNINSAKE
jgi:hypothetical protein